MSINRDVNGTPAASQRPFNLKAGAVIGGTAIAAALIAFVVLPAAQGRLEGLDVFAAICRAIGLQSVNTAALQGQTTGSGVAFDAATRDLLAAGDAERGRTYAADVCSNCHFANGLSSDPATIPTISGQSARALYKQLHDIKTGVRDSEIMKPIVEELDDQQMSDLAAYFSGLPRRNHNNPESIAVSEGTVALILKGDASRNLPACAACHEPRAGGPLETPHLTGQYPDYLETQLRAYADGRRRNDLFGRMRTISAKLTPQEMRELSAYYNAPAYD